MSTLHKSVLKSGLPPRGPAPMAAGSKRVAGGRKRDYTPVSYDKYFESFEDVNVKGNSFRVYRLGTQGPVVFLLHGGGFSGLTWSLFAASLQTMAECQILAMDLRGHGDTHVDEEDDLSAETLAMDVGAVIQSLYADCDIPATVLVGHSMGGAVAVRAAAQGLIPGLAGLAVIDVVEGTAMDALNSMQSFLRGRPRNFRSLDHAIEWCVRSGQVRNVDSARVSMPGQLINIKTGKLATYDISAASTPSDDSPLGPDLVKDVNLGCIQEDDEIDSTAASHSISISNNFKAPAPPGPGPGSGAQVDSNATYTWRIDLGHTEKHWSGWFQGLSSTFLSVSCPKMLLLAGIDRLDRELTVGQMQGKFQMQVLPQCGHAVQEDSPDSVAEVLANFLIRYKLAEPVSEFHASLPAC